MKSFALRDGMRIAYQEWGNAQSVKKIVAVHGWLDNSNSFHLLGPKVAALGYHCVAIDLIGHGKSSHIGPEAIYTTPNGVAYMNEIVDNLGWASTDVLGTLLHCFPPYIA
jgi:pimeloyl-ACP methyl ester carboxylesterase